MLWPPVNEAEDVVFVAPALDEVVAPVLDEVVAPVLDEVVAAASDDDVVEDAAALELELVATGIEDEPDEPGAADEEVVAAGEEEVVGPAGAAVAAQEQTARAADWTCNALLIPQAEITQL